MNLTPNETKMLRNIVLNDYQSLNGAEPASYDEVGGVWSNCLDCGPENIPASSRSGVVASLVKKGLAVVDGRGDDATVGLTRAGYDAYVATRGAR